MKHKHSPNFIENEYEARNAKNNRAATFFLAYLLLVVFLIGLSVTKTKAQSDTLRPDNALSIFRDTTKMKDATHLIGTVIDYGEALQIRTADTVKVVMMVSDTAANKHQEQSYFNLSEYKSRSKENFSILDVTDGQLVEIATPLHYQPYIIYGYEVTEKQYYSPTGGDLKIRTNKTTYLNHKKQPLPDRLIVWMAIRRNEK